MYSLKKRNQKNITAGIDNGTEVWNATKKQVTKVEKAIDL